MRLWYVPNYSWGACMMVWWEPRAAISGTLHPHTPTGGNGRQQPGQQGRESDILTKAFLRKYIFYAKSRVKPKVGVCVCVVGVEG